MKKQRKNTVSNLESPEMSVGQENSFNYSNSFLNDKLKLQNEDVQLGQKSGANRNPRIPFHMFHEDIDIHHADNAPDKSRPEIEKDQRLVQLKRTEDNPIKTKKEPKSEKSLFLSQNKRKDKKPNGDWHAVKKQVGTIDKPRTEHHLVSEDIFLKNKPKSSDIIQGGLGTCYFLAAVNSVVDKDPNQIQKIMKINGENVTVDFHYFDQNGAADSQWKKATIQTDTSVVQFNSGSENHMIGSTFRVSDKPKYTNWYGDIDNKTLSVNKDAYYEGAIWVALMEKAYAIFAEKYGQYGGFDKRYENHRDNQTSGYTIIEGGQEFLVYNLLYGNNMKGIGYSPFEYDPAEADKVDPEMIKYLLLANGVDVPEGEHYHVTSAIMPYYSILRLHTQLEHFLSLGSLNDLTPSFLNTLQLLGNKTDEYQTLLNTEPYQVAKSLEPEIAKIAGDIISPKVWSANQSQTHSTELKRLQDLLLVVNQLGDDNGAGQRFIYASHAYAVMNTTLRNDQNKVVTPTLHDLDNNPPSINAENSTVTIRNPHGANVEDRMGEGTPDNDGLMKMTLEEFNRVFQELQFGHASNK